MHDVLPELELVEPFCSCFHRQLCVDESSLTSGGFAPPLWSIQIYSLLGSIVSQLTQCKGLFWTRNVYCAQDGFLFISLCCFFLSIVAHPLSILLL